MNTDTLNGSSIDDPYSKTEQKIKDDRNKFQKLHNLREVVFGAQDGIISTATIATALALADASFTVLFIGGATTALAGMVSMSIGAYLATQTEQQVEESETERELLEIIQNREEKEAEYKLLTSNTGASITDFNANNPELATNILVYKLGIVPDINTNPIRDAIVMGISFVLGSAFPLLPYIVGGVNTVSMSLSIFIALLILTLLGAFKGKIIKRSPIRQAVGILTLGSISAAIAFIIGYIIPRILGVE